MSVAEAGAGESTLGYWCAAWIDLLGQREAFRRTDFVPSAENPEQVKAFYEAARDCIGAIRGMRKIHAALRKGLTEGTESDIFAELSPDGRATARRFQVTRVREFKMSDGMLLACPLKPEDGNVPLRGVYEIVLTCATMMLVQLAGGRPIRGGIDVGTGIELDGELFGAALVKAYEIESSRAEYPRIVVGQDFVNLLHSGQQQRPVDLRARYERQICEGLLRSLKKDRDGEFIVDYLGPGIREFLGRGQYAILPEACAFAERARSKYREEKNEKLFGRYSQLVQYLDGVPR